MDPATTLTRIVLLLAVISVISCASISWASAQAVPGIEWSKTYGSSRHDSGSSVVQCRDGGFAFTGATSNGSGVALTQLVKTGPCGELEWNRTYQILNGSYGKAIVQTPDGGYVIAGGTDFFGYAKAPVFLLKTDPSGNLVWLHTYGGIDEDECYSLIQTTDGGFAIRGTTKSYKTSKFGDREIWLIKTDESGVLQWYSVFEGTTMVYSGDTLVMQTGDGGYVTGGALCGIEDDGVGLIKTDSNGKLQWNRTFDIHIGNVDSIIQTKDGGYALTGYVDHPPYMDIYLIKTDTDGNVQWKRQFSRSGNTSIGEVILQTEDGGYALLGTTINRPTERFEDRICRIWLIKTDGEGVEQWSQIIEEPVIEDSTSMKRTADNGFVIAGTTNIYGNTSGDACLVKIGYSTVGSSDTEVTTRPQACPTQDEQPIPAGTGEAIGLLALIGGAVLNLSVSRRKK